VETPPDGSQVSPLAGYDAGGHALAAIEPLEGDGAVLAELAQPLSTISPRRTTRRPPSAYAHDGPTLRRSAAATASRLSRRPRKTLALYLKALETQRSLSGVSIHSKGTAQGRAACADLSLARRCGSQLLSLFYEPGQHLDRRGFHLRGSSLY